MIIAIDGPAGSGKSTVARLVARRLGMHYLDTGAMYRAIAVLAGDRSLTLDDDDAVAALTAAEPVTFTHEGDDPLPSRVLIAGSDVTARIRTPDADRAVSVVARLPKVREAMVAQQRAIGSSSDIVVEGRDIGTVVFPDAAVKVFLTASAEERARRRTAQHDERGHGLSANEVKQAIDARDRADSTRAVAPLAAAADAVEVDTTGLTIDEVVDRITRIAEGRRS